MEGVIETVVVEAKRIPPPRVAVAGVNPLLLALVGLAALGVLLTK